jgi:hypothetical protein
MKSATSHGSSSVLFVMKVMVGHFVGGSHNMMTAVVAALPSNCHFGDFSANFEDMCGVE